MTQNEVLQAETTQPEAHYTRRRVVITGMGAITPIGMTLETIWENLIHANSGIDYLTSIATDDLTCKIGGECREFNPENYMEKKDARRMDRYTQFGLASARLAMQDAQLEGKIDPERLGVVVSSGAGGICTIEQQLRSALVRGFSKCSPFLVPMMLCDSAGGRISIEFQAKGPNFAVVTACASGSDSIGEAFRMIQTDEADAVIAGGAEAPMTALSVAGFASARALSTRNENPKTACRPFDRERDGFVMSEGSGIIILEELSHALSRGAKIYGELLGYGRSSDANDIVAPCADGDGAARAMKAALRNAHTAPGEVQYINAHGTSTPQGDIAETLAMKRVFGDHAKRNLKISSTKSMTGHLLGAAGSLEGIISLLALKHKMIPPTINLEHADEQCDLDYTPNTAVSLPDLKMVMSNSFGFGGHNASLVFREYCPN